MYSFYFSWVTVLDKMLLKAPTEIRSDWATSSIVNASSVKSFDLFIWVLRFLWLKPSLEWCLHYSCIRQFLMRKTGLSIVSIFASSGYSMSIRRFHQIKSVSLLAAQGISQPLKHLDGILLQIVASIWTIFCTFWRIITFEQFHWAPISHNRVKVVNFNNV